jgi:hypothetical protein
MPAAASPPRSPHPVVPRWIGVVFPATIASAIVFGIAYVVNVTFVPFVVALTASAGLGLTSGFATRWSLKHRHLLVRLSAAIIGLTVGLLLLGLITLGDAGIGPLNYSNIAPDWAGLLQLASGIVTATLALLAGRSPVPWLQSAGHPRTLALSARIRARGSQVRDWWEGTGLFRSLTQLGQRFVDSEEAPPPAQRSPSRRPRVVREIRSEMPPRPFRPNRLQVMLSGWKEGLNRRGRAVMNWRSRLGVRVGEVAENRCPYCLDTIHRNDPRGTVVCSICHTPHHADCWAVTGMCQIPHKH